MAFPYFAEAGDVEIAGERLPHTSEGNRVTHLIDGNAYFGALRQEIEDLLADSAGGYFYFTSWWLGLVDGPSGATTSGGGSLTTAWTMDAGPGGLTPFRLEDGSGEPAPDLIGKLERMARAGIDVRALAWMSPFLVPYQEAGERAPNYWYVNVHTLLSAHALRARSGLGERVMLNTLAHPVGAMHAKLVLCGNNSGMRAYASGLDFVSDRVAGPDHSGDDVWHDAGVRIEGPGATAVYAYFQQLWAEQLGRGVQTFRVSGRVVESHNRNWPQVPVREAPPLGTSGSQAVQVLRTLPQMNFALGSTPVVPVDFFKRIAVRFRRERISFAEDGLFEFRLALRKAIAQAQRYIYIEDQAFTSIDIMRWINDRLRRRPGLKAMLLHGADPSDPPNTAFPEAVKMLAKDLPNPSEQVAFYLRGGGLVVHSKVTIIDDQWAAVGSANCMRRSLYTDGELSVGVVDTQSPTFAQQLRKDLWGEHCGLSIGAARDVLLNLDSALGLWDPTWGSTPAGVTLKPELERLHVPFEISAPGPGVVTVIGGSATVVGTGTGWDAGLVGRRFKRVGDPAELVYAVRSVISPTELLLDRPYEGRDASGVRYRFSEPGRWLLDELRPFNQAAVDRQDPDSREEF